MLYRVIGLMSGSSLDGLDIAFTELHETSGKWSFSLRNTACIEYSAEWVNRLKHATSLTALEYQQLHIDYGHFVGQQVNSFIEAHQLQYQVQLIASHGHTTFHDPAHQLTAQLGDGASIAAETGINTVSDLRSIDVALGGQGAPLVPIGEKLLFPEHTYFLNLGGIANVSAHTADHFVAYDVCPANAVLNALANKAGKNYDDGGQLAAKGNVLEDMLEQLNNQEYYRHAYPKSLSNSFGTEQLLPMIENGNADIDDALRTYVEHICWQVMRALSDLQSTHRDSTVSAEVLVTGGGAKNAFLIERLQKTLKPISMKVVVPSHEIVDFKEALIMALIGVLRWREENNSLASVTGASRDSIGGAVWMGLEA